jgi:hypothetical protein
MRHSAFVLTAFMAMALMSFASRSSGEDLPEYRLKAAFLYNFSMFTDWPEGLGPTVNLCVYGRDPFGAEIDGLQGKMVGERQIAVHRTTRIESLKDCQVLFIAQSAADGLPQVIAALHGAPVLTIADSPGALDQGVILNMSVVKDRISFEANLAAARAVGLNLSSKLLRLATKVRQ